MPSIHEMSYKVVVVENNCFKPYYNWNAFNTLDFDKSTDFMVS